jgi:hypothetical protein
MEIAADDLRDLSMAELGIIRMNQIAGILVLCHFNVIFQLSMIDFTQNCVNFRICEIGARVRFRFRFFFLFNTFLLSLNLFFRKYLVFMFVYHCLGPQKIKVAEQYLVRFSPAFGQIIGKDGR